MHHLQLISIMKFLHHETTPFESPGSRRDNLVGSAVQVVHFRTFSPYNWIIKLGYSTSSIDDHMLSYLVGDASGLFISP